MPVVHRHQNRLPAFLTARPTQNLGHCCCGAARKQRDTTLKSESGNPSFPAVQLGLQKSRLTMETLLLMIGNVVKVVEGKIRARQTLPAGQLVSLKIGSDHVPSSIQCVVVYLAAHVFNTMQFCTCISITSRPSMAWPEFFFWGRSGATLRSDNMWDRLSAKTRGVLATPSPKNEDPVGVGWVP